jgi:molybdenum cofactor cytidylyltransferase
MARAPSVAGVILAAGESSRMGRDKALLPWRGETFLGAAIDVFQMNTELVIVVAGRNVENVRPIADARGAFTVINPAPERGQFSSLQVGLQEVLNRGRDAAMITLVDRPIVQQKTIVQLWHAFEESLLRGKWAVVPEHDGRHGHPIIVAREMITAFLTAPGTSTARDVEHSNQSKIEYVPVKDRFAVENVDTQEDYARITTDV